MDDISRRSSEVGTMAGFVRVRGAREHNLKDVSVDIPRDALVVFTGISGSGKSSLAFGTLYAEAQRRYLESVSPYARRLFHQMAVPQVDTIDGLPPAVALQQQRGSPTTRSSVGSITTLSNFLRMLYSRAGDYPKGQALVYAESFSPNTPEGACPKCHGMGRIIDATENTMVPDDTLTIRERAIAAWPTAWGGQNLRDILVSMGYDVDRPWRDLPKKDRDWILFTDEQPTVPVYAGYTPAETKRALKRKEEPSYQGTFIGARKNVLHTFANTQSALMKRRVAQYMISSECPLCHGKRLRKEALSVKFAGLDIAELSRLPLKRLNTLLTPYSDGQKAPDRNATHPEKTIVVQRIAQDLLGRLSVLLDLGLGYLTLERSTPTLSPGELQRLRLATQVRSNLFGVVYVLDEPSAGLHPADTEALLRAFDRLKASGNSLFVVEHELDVIRRADWIVDVGPGAGEHGGRVIYSGPPAGLAHVEGFVYRAVSFRKAFQNGDAGAQGQGLAMCARRHPQQSRRPRCRHSAWGFHERHGNFRLRQIDLDQPVPCRRDLGRPWPALRGFGGGRTRRCHRNARRRNFRGARQGQAARRRRPEAHRQDTAFEPCDIYRIVRSRSKTVRCYQRGESPPLRRGSIFFQRCEGPLPDM